MTIVADALLPPQSTDTAPINPKIVTGNVLVSTLVSTTENRNSFHEKSTQSTVVATHSTAGKVDRTRPLCAYPTHAHYKESGDQEDAKNFECRP